MLDVLIIAAHPDDAEIAAGGTLAKMERAGYQVGILDLTNGEPTPNGDPETRMEEAKRAKEKLELSFRKTLGFPNRYLSDDLEPRVAAAEVIRVQRPQILLTQHPDDVHPDHVAPAKIGKYGRFYGKLTKTEMAGDPYYVPLWLNFYSSHQRSQKKSSFLIDVSATMEQKMSALKQYETQLGQKSPHKGALAAIRDYNRNWGRKLGTQYCEPFHSPEMLGLNNLDSIVPPGE